MAFVNVEDRVEMSATADDIRAAEVEIEEDFALFDDVREKIEYVIDLGKDLPPLPEPLKTEANRVRGCQSQVWLVADLDPATRHISLRADSDAVIVKGLISLVLRLYNDRTPEAITASTPAVFERIGLGRMLTPGRANGLYAMIERVRQLAAAYESAATTA
jgi:cysteine desulfuration protein SufE